MIATLVDEVFANETGTPFAVSEYELSVRLDVRPLVLRTILTYLELEGLAAAGDAVLRGLLLPPGRRARSRTCSPGSTTAAPTSCADSSRAARPGAVWTTLDPEASANALGEDRERIVAALGHLEERQLIEVRATSVHQRYTVLDRPSSGDELVDRLVERFERRERAETERIQRVVSLVTHEGCQVNELVGYFGDVRDEPCGHCSFCLRGRSATPAATRSAPRARRRRRRAGARGARGRPSRCARDAAPTRSLSLRHHEPRDDPCEAHARAGLRLARPTGASPTCWCGARPSLRAGSLSRGAAWARWPSRSSKPVRCGSPTLGRFDSGAAPSKDCEHSSRDRGDLA